MGQTPSSRGSYIQSGVVQTKMGQYEGCPQTLLMVRDVAIEWPCFNTQLGGEGKIPIGNSILPKPNGLHDPLEIDSFMQGVWVVMVNCRVLMA